MTRVSLTEVVRMRARPREVRRERSIHPVNGQHLLSLEILESSTTLYTPTRPPTLQNMQLTVDSSLATPALIKS